MSKQESVVGNGHCSSEKAKPHKRHAKDRTKSRPNPKAKYKKRK